jgi:hypothetical protein
VAKMIEVFGQLDARALLAGGKAEVFARGKT